MAIAPSAFGESLSLQQRVHVEAVGRELDLDVVLEIAPDEVTLVGIALGQRVLTLRYDGVKLTESRHALLPRDVRGRDILSDMQLALWPTSAVRAALPRGWTITDTDGGRVVSQGADEVLRITYEATPRWKGVMTVRNLRYNYRLQITSVVAEP